MKVLIAEDDLYIRQGLRDLLDNEGYECIEAADGEQALALFEQEAPDLILLDIMMPKIDGYTLCRTLRQRNALLPILFVTAKSEEIDQVLGLELGADDYIKKPFGTREVIARIRAVTRRCLQQHSADNSQASQASQAFSLGDLQVYPAELRAQRQEQRIELSLRDTRILELLYRERGKVVDRDSLFNHCWGRDYLPSSRTLDQHISKLRKLIEPDPRQPSLIRTVHGVGYRYDPQ